MLELNAILGMFLGNMSFYFSKKIPGLGLLCACLAIFLGIYSMKRISNDSNLRGRFAAMFSIIFGSLGLIMSFYRLFQ